MRTLAATDMSVYSTADFEAAYTYEGDDLGAAWTKDSATFRVWAPTADSVSVDGKEHEACDPYARTTGVNGQRAMMLVKEATVPKVSESQPSESGSNPFPALLGAMCAGLLAGVLVYKKKK